MNRVLGTGTALDSSRFRSLIASALALDSRSVHGYIIGEHGDSSGAPSPARGSRGGGAPRLTRRDRAPVPVWSSVSFGGMTLRSVNPLAGLDGDEEDWASIHTQVVQGAAEVGGRRASASARAHTLTRACARR